MSSKAIIFKDHLLRDLGTSSSSKFQDVILSWNRLKEGTYPTFSNKDIYKLCI